MKVIDKIKFTFKELFEEITVVEYILWWALRIALIYATINFPDPTQQVMLALNTLALFAIPFLRLIFPRNSVVSRIDFRTQNIINFFEFIGSFLGKYLDAYSYIAKYDRLLHILSGVGVVWAGYYIFKAFDSTNENKKTYRPKSIGLATAFSTFFSFTVIVFWEIVEFYGDYLFGSQNQGYLYAPAEDDIMYRIFGHPCQQGQAALWDTMMDMIDATFATVITAFIMLAILKFIKVRAEKKEALALNEGK